MEMKEALKKEEKERSEGVEIEIMLD